MPHFELDLNGERRAIDAEGDTPLLWILRDTLGLTGTKYGCGSGYCGTCTVLLNGQAVRSCTLPVRGIADADVTTIEGLARDGSLHPLQQAFVDQGALQCGFCTPGILMNMDEFLKVHPNPSDDEIRTGLVGNLCRCTGYAHIVDAVRDAAKRAR
jgi:aerobic-type carbon monoxide dehydrogenase small subunit (CoxS/CutS family)